MAYRWKWDDHLGVWGQAVFLAAAFIPSSVVIWTVIVVALGIIPATLLSAMVGRGAAR